MSVRVLREGIACGIQAAIDWHRAMRDGARRPSHRDLEAHDTAIRELGKLKSIFIDAAESKTNG
ncbi:hypothetical protein [Parvibaculum sp.]|uniref:hypothetical protein n=1 Tax=Parvibaculum sp. TaxID=2024848 RepID=UPI002732B13C|nr:hypothetical protein [Parvibaculum sp.]MDP3329397.1 hypothetical protein [Parvibaculum sp.]